MIADWRGSANSEADGQIEISRMSRLRALTETDENWFQSQSIFWAVESRE